MDGSAYLLVEWRTPSSGQVFVRPGRRVRGSTVEIYFGTGAIVLFT